MASALLLFLSEHAHQQLTLKGDMDGRGRVGDGGYGCGREEGREN